MKWNKLYLRDMTEEELANNELKDDLRVVDGILIWDGDIPEPDKWLVIKRYIYSDPFVDKWFDGDAEYGDPMSFYYTDDIDECYWLPIPEVEE